MSSIFSLIFYAVLSHVVCAQRADSYRISTARSRIRRSDMVWLQLLCLLWQLPPIQTHSQLGLASLHVVHVSCPHSGLEQSVLLWLKNLKCRFCRLVLNYLSKLNWFWFRWYWRQTSEAHWFLKSSRRAVWPRTRQLGDAVYATWHVQCVWSWRLRRESWASVLRVCGRHVRVCCESLGEVQHRHSFSALGLWCQSICKCLMKTSSTYCSGLSDFTSCFSSRAISYIDIFRLQLGSGTTVQFL